MAGVVEALAATWSGGSAYSRVNIEEGARNNNEGWVDVNWWHSSRDTHGGVSGTWDWSRSGIVSGSGSVPAATGLRVIGNGTRRFYCDANGYFPETHISQRLDVFYGAATATSYITPSRAPKAPANNAPVASNISVVSARVTASVANNGHGTSSSFNIRYRKQGSANWIERGWGSSTWDLPNLTPGTVYEMSSMARNNNNDTNSWTTGSYTFTTLPAPSVSVPLLSVIGVL